MRGIQLPINAMSLKNARKKALMSQKEAAYELCVSQSTISEWESGKKLPSFSQVLHLCALYKISIEDLSVHYRGECATRGTNEKQDNVIKG